MLQQTPTTIRVEATQSDSKMDPPPPRPQSLLPCGRDVPASSPMPPLCDLPESPPPAVWSTPRPAPPTPCPPPPPASDGLANIPLVIQHTPDSDTTIVLSQAFRTLLACIDICVVVLSMYITSTEASTYHLAQRKKSKREGEDDVSGSAHMALRGGGVEEDGLEHPHYKQVFDLLAWHVGVLNDRWYIKPRSTCLV